MKKAFIIVVLFVLMIFSFNSTKLCFAKEKSINDVIGEQLNNLDFSSLEDFYNNLDIKPNAENFFSIVQELLKGNYSSQQIGFKDYFFNILLTNIKTFLPQIVSIVILSIISSLASCFKGKYLSENLSSLLNISTILCVFAILFSSLISSWQTSKKAIESIAKLNEIMSPIILTLMVATGANVSASIFKPTVLIFSNLVVNIILVVVLPLIGIMTILSVINDLSYNIKLNRFIDFIANTIKWLLGIIIVIYGFYISVQGISAAIYDGVSIKAAKYAISNSVPIIGGFLKDGFDIVLAGTILIKNSVGISSVFLLFFTLLSPVIYLGVFSMSLKLIASFTENFSEGKVSNFCFSLSKCISYLNIATILTGFMMFISILLMIISANAFI